MAFVNPEKDLDPKAEAFIVGWAREVPDDAPLGLIVYLERPAGIPEEAELLGEAVREYFSHRAEASRQQLRQLFRVGRRSLVIGMICLTASLALGDRISRVLSGTHLGELLRRTC